MSWWLNFSYMQSIYVNTSNVFIKITQISYSFLTRTSVFTSFCSTTTMAEGESSTPILRPGVVSSNVIPQAPPPGVPVVGNIPPSSIPGNPFPTQQHQQGHNGIPNSNPFDSGSGPQDSPMHQISLTSPPHVPTNMRNAEFY